ncbi:HIT family protein [uncultured Sphingomonas sp.]|nr:HIT family protein [uncultured Sphingomonas sp.]
MMAHATLTKFGYPATAIVETEHWALLVRPAQVTLGSLVLCARSEALAYGDLPEEAFAEQRELVSLAERLLRELVAYERINYLMLMMVDPHVHFHVVPRYEGARAYDGTDFPDLGWPGVPNLRDSQPAPAALVTDLRNRAAKD